MENIEQEMPLMFTQLYNNNYYCNYYFIINFIVFIQYHYFDDKDHDKHFQFYNYNNYYL